MHVYQAKDVPSKAIKQVSKHSAVQQTAHSVAHGVTHTALSAVSPLYSAPPQPPKLEAVPTDQDFIAALHGLGFKSQPAGAGEDSKQGSLSDMHEGQPAKGTVYHLQLVLRTLAAVCTFKSKVIG